MADNCGFAPVEECSCCRISSEVEIPEESADDKPEDAALAASTPANLLRQLYPTSTSTFVNEEDDRKEKPKWIGRFQYILGTLSYSVSLGNIWRFPYLCYKNGGGSFLVPYFLMLIFVGWPLVLLEMSVGQFSSKGSVAVWQICPLFEGIGYAMMAVSLLVSLYYAVLIGWALFFLFDSFRDNVQFEFCNQTWNTEHCYRRADFEECLDSTENETSLYFNQTCFDETEIGVYNISLSTLINQTHRVLPSEEYFKYQVLGLSDGIGHWGEQRWENSLCLAAAWFLIILCLFKGIKTSGKIVYFTATFPYLVLFVFLVRALTLEGSQDGLRYYLVPDKKRLADPNIWIDAGGQALFSLGVAFGGLFTLSSYNKFQNNCLRDASTIYLVDALTSFLSGAATFAVLGFLAHETGRPIHDVVQSGSGLAFVVYPEAIVRMPWKGFWCAGAKKMFNWHCNQRLVFRTVLFFLMLIVIGLDSTTSIIETTMGALAEKHKIILKYRGAVLLGLCFVSFLAGLPLCTNAGLYWFTLLNDYAATVCLLLLALLENTVIVSIYGINRLCEDIEMMIGVKPWAKVRPYWKLCWLITVPGLITGILVFYWASYVRTPFEPAFPLWAEILGWMTALLAVAIIPATSLLKLAYTNEDVPLLQKLKAFCWPAEDWGPTERNCFRSAASSETSDKSSSTELKTVSQTTA